MGTIQKRKSIVIPAIIGNILEWYDFTLYAYFATIFATLYFPADDKFLSMLVAYGILAASYFMRPVGALVFGYIGDSLGRKSSLYYSIILMGVCSFLVSILPTYADWGAMAGIALVMIRLVQGFAVGGEYSGATLCLIESAKPERRTFFGSLALASLYSGFLISSAMGMLLTFIFPPEQLAEWGWRLGFAFGGLIAIVGFYIRKNMHNPLPEPQVRVKLSNPPLNPIKNLFYNHPKKLIFALGLAVFPAGFSYMIFVYFLNFLETQGGLSLQGIFYMNTIAMMFMVAATPLIGLLADKIGRKPLMLSSVIITVLICIPLFQLLMDYPLLALLIFVLLNAMYEACLAAEIAPLFPHNCRYTGVALTLNLSNGVVGGLAPMIAATLVYTTNILVSPMFYVIGIGLITIFSFMFSLKKGDPTLSCELSLEPK